MACRVSRITTTLTSLMTAAVLAVSTAAHSAEIHDAAKLLDIERVIEILDKDPDQANARLAGGILPLHIAASLDSPKMVQALIDADIDINAASHSGATALHWAAMMNSAKVIGLLLNAGADPALVNREADSPIGTARKYNSDKALAALGGAGSGALAPERMTESSSATRMFVQGRQAYKEGRFPEAYDIFTDLFRANPADERVNLALGLSAFRIGKFSYATLAFERALAMDPGNERARLELGRTYLAAGQVKLAEASFRKVLESNPPAEVRAGVERLLSEMRRIESKAGVRFSVEVGGLYDDNINVGPVSELIEISPVTVGTETFSELQIGEDSEPLETGGAFVTLSAAGSHEIGQDGGWGAIWEGALYKSWLEKKAEDNEIFYGGLSAGARRWGTRNLFQCRASYSHITRGDSGLVDSIGVAPVITFFPVKRGGLRTSLQASVEQRTYDEELEARDGQYWKIGAVLRHAIGARSAVTLGLLGLHEATDAGIYENSGGEIIVGAETAAMWGMSGYLRARYRMTSYSEKEELAPADREDDRIRVEAGVMKTMAGRWALGLKGSVTDNSSTFDLYDYERSVVTLSVVRVF